MTSGWVYCFVRVCVRSLKDWQLQCDVGYKLNWSQLLWHVQLDFLDPVFGGEKKKTNPLQYKQTGLNENDGKTCVFAEFGLNAA